MQDRVKGPGIALVVAGVIGVLLCLVSIVGLMLGGFANQLREMEDQGEPVAKAFVVLIDVVGVTISLAGCAFQIYGGLQMQRLKSWGVCLAACIVSLLPCVGCCLAGLPIGIWGLVVLLNDDVKKAFAGAAGVSSDL